MNDSSFDWDDAKDMENQLKHGVSFTSAQQAFLDSKRIIAEDTVSTVSKNSVTIVLGATKAALEY